MKTIAFLSQKGGSGKTTLSVHTAVAAGEVGERVVVIDTDPQKSATVWGDSRENDVPVVATAAASELTEVIRLAKEETFSLAIVDTAPHAAPDATRIARQVDLVLIPCRPTAFDIAAAENAVSIVRAAGTPSAFVLSACPFRAPEISETREFLSQFELPIVPDQITERRAFSRAIATGQAVTEFEEEGKAAQEVRDLWKWIHGELNHG